MPARFEEEPEPDEEPGETAVAAPPAPMVPSVAPASREFEYRTEMITPEEVGDGSTLAERLNKASTEGWDLVDVIQAGERYTLLLRHPRTPDREERRVGFLPPVR